MNGPLIFHETIRLYTFTTSQEHVEVTYVPAAWVSLSDDACYYIELCIYGKEYRLNLYNQSTWFYSDKVKKAIEIPKKIQLSSVVTIIKSPFDLEMTSSNLDEKYYELPEESIELEVSVDKIFLALEKLERLRFFL